MDLPAEHEHCSRYKIAVNVFVAARLQQPPSNDVPEHLFFGMLFSFRNWLIVNTPGSFVNLDRHESKVCLATVYTVQTFLSSPQEHGNQLIFSEDVKSCRTELQT